MLSRRTALAGFGAAALMLPVRRVYGADEGPILTEDGLHKQPWFLDSFLELGDDLATAAEQKKRFAVIWELKGCPYCKETHFVNFARDDISDYVKSNFDILQLNIIGSRKVTDFDGEVLPEKKLARKYGVRFTPTIQFFGEDAGKMKGLKPKAREVARAQGYLKPDHFLSMFRFVASRSYTQMSFRKYLKAQG